MKNFDIAVIGAGPAGYTAAIKLGECGKSVALIDLNEKKIGGTCLNEGCIPVKSLLESAELYEKIVHSENFGIKIESKFLNIKDVQDVMNSNIDILRKGIVFKLKKANVALIYGQARFLSNEKILVKNNETEEEIEASKFVIATGSIAKILPGFKVDQEDIFDSWGAMNISKLPKSILIIGGGVVGCEFATFFNKIGVEVTIVEMASQLIPGEDNEISRTLQREFKKNKINIKLNSKIINKIKTVNGFEITIENDKGKHDVFFSEKILVSIGRKANIEKLDLEKTGVRILNGKIETDNFMLTSGTNIYAAGDVLPSLMLAHTAYREGIIVAESILEKVEHDNSKIVVPRIVFSDPQIACAGLTEEQAKNLNIETVVNKSFFKANGKALIHKKEAGFVKMITERDTGVIIGVAMIGPCVTELIHESLLAMKNNLTLKDMKNLIHGHPTLSEIVAEL